MEIKELDKKQLVLLTLLITFVVSIATGIVTVSLMNQMPKAVPQTINNVIQRTIEKVTTVQVPAPVVKDEDEENNSASLFGNNNEALVSIYKNDVQNEANSNPESPSTLPDDNTTEAEPVPLGQGVLISDIGLILVDSSILLADSNISYKVILGETDFNASVLKSFSNGFTIMKISVITDEPTEETTENTETGNSAQ